MVYVYLGGFRSVVRTDILQFVLMFGGFALILPFCLIEYGGLDFLTGALPDGHFTWHGGNTLQYILVWYAIATATLIEPAFYQRCYAAKSESVARRGTGGRRCFRSNDRSKNATDNGNGFPGGVKARGMTGSGG